MANYHTLEIDGRNVPVSFGWGAMVKFEEKTGVRFPEFQTMLEKQEYPMGLLLVYVLTGLMEGARKAGIIAEDCPFQTVTDVADFLDEHPDALLKITNIAQSDNDALGDEKKPGPKKKGPKPPRPPAKK